MLPYPPIIIRSRSHDHHSMMIGSSLFGMILLTPLINKIINGSMWENDPEAIH
jgi:hypothetical protein